ncbi:hypothetical protein NB705_003113 [Xanthomonas sacchari]|nr:hypothetical protein [Xanthomonas sacchari]
MRGASRFCACNARGVPTNAYSAAVATPSARIATASTAPLRPRLRSGHNTTANTSAASATAAADMPQLSIASPFLFVLQR